MNNNEFIQKQRELNEKRRLEEEEREKKLKEHLKVTTSRIRELMSHYPEIFSDDNKENKK